jgi:hypothetical protein
MSTFLLLTLSRWLGGFGFWWTDAIAVRAEAAALEDDTREVVVYARSATPEESEHELHTALRIDTHDGISNGF